MAAFDPHIGPEHYPEGIEVVDSIESAEGFDIAILVTAHRSSIELDWADLAGRMRNPIIYDGRRVLDLEKLSELGWQTHAVGRP
ncbi:MAG: UDP binding domain-containing protein [Candidatus Poseidoniaceae archaeon]|nr:UDP binding domain-containing protein [Candidatus Poseidoniaceae archaeon]